MMMSFIMIIHHHDHHSSLFIIIHHHSSLFIIIMSHDDPWDAFPNDENDENALITAGINHFVQHSCRHNPQISSRWVACTDCEWTTALKRRHQQEGLLVLVSDNKSPCDACIIVQQEDYKFSSQVVPGGLLLVVVTLESNQKSAASVLKTLHPAVWCPAVLIHEEPNTTLWAMQRVSCPINSRACPWASLTDMQHERALLQQATVTRSASELIQPDSVLTSHSVHHAVQALRDYGYCIVRSLFRPNHCRAGGQAALQDFQAAANILQQRLGIDLYHPHDNPQHEPQSYRELSMREDLRMDLRDGPSMRQFRTRQEKTQDSHAPTVLHNGHPGHSCLRFHPTVLQIVRQALNPVDTNLYRGNVGRYNFDGTGPDGSPQNLRIGPLGAILSLPGAADQALHADTPHLFESIDTLPPHYINAFSLGMDIPYEMDETGLSTGNTTVGGTCFIHASHKLSFTAQLKDLSIVQEPLLRQNVVRPSLEVGDLLLFDCRILHFGLANTSLDTIRPVLYTNMTHDWFQDPKNWNDRDSIFQFEKDKSHGTM
jgi:hypothetical protein